MTAPGKKPVLVRQVFAEDLEREFALIRSAIDKYPFVSMDTEFPGTIFKQDKNLIHQADPAINYLFMKSNVDALRIIQLGLTLADSQGNLPDFNTPYRYVWEFNFKDFDFERDYCDKESIELLKIQGIDFVKNKKKGFFGLHGGLEKVAKLLNVARVAGVSHQAGSDSLLTLQCLMELKQSKVFDRINNGRMLPALALYGLVTVLG
ncbi:Polynucleotidyl transferase, putative [Theobroma cacao]|uniref:poly(A)-specific ribonuclease n=1 Tax=Theobroma cacao TaxID=3641 RepID=A0A061E6W8_THECC|nr:Polynucleotidyl transferase, putative [Theobroma cacao]